MVVAERFRIDGSLGQGGMGEVYRAWDKKLARPVALKWIRADQRDDASVTGRFLREARAAAALRHPNIVAVYDLGEDAGAMYIVMELVDGRPLRSFVGDASVPIPRRLTWLEQIASALAAAHAAGVVHRDVKPSNVMIGSDGQVRVLDFGLAKRTDAAPPHGPRDTGMVPSFRTAHGMVLGTPTYMAPEQARGEHVDVRADQYAWGLVAFELLLGRRWDPSMPHETPPPNPLLADVWPVLRRATEPDPNARFPSMVDVLSLLGRARTGAAAGAPPTITMTSSSPSRSVPAPPTVASPAPTFTSPPPLTNPPLLTNPPPPVPIAAPTLPVAGSPPGRGALFAALGAVSALAIVGLVLLAFVVGRRTASPAQTQAPPDASSPFTAVSVTPSAAPAVSSARPTQTAAAGHRPAPSASAPAQPARLKYGDELAKTNFLPSVEFFSCATCDWDSWYATFQKTRAPFAACYTKTIYTPPYHRYVRYQVDVAADGQFTGIRQVFPDAQNVVLDECILQALRSSVPLKKTGGGPGKLQFQLNDDCRAPLVDGERKFDRCE